eukprot:9969089-Alexandrium_andersonii.AAC.1
MCIRDRPVARAAAAPRGPTAEEREQHELSGHSTPAPWCPHCTMGKGRDDGHHRDAEAENAIPVVEADYTFMTANLQPAKDGDDATVKVVTILT